MLLIVGIIANDHCPRSTDTTPGITPACSVCVQSLLQYVYVNDKAHAVADCV